MQASYIIRKHATLYKIGKKPNLGEPQPKLRVLYHKTKSVYITMLLSTLTAMKLTEMLKLRC